MPHLFAVERKRGGSWDFARPMEQQADWPEHAAFMDALVTEGFIALGGVNTGLLTSKRRIR